MVCPLLCNPPSSSPSHSAIIAPPSSTIDIHSRIAIEQLLILPVLLVEKHHPTELSRPSFLRCDSSDTPAASYAPNATENASKHTTVHHDLKHPSRWLRRAHFNTATVRTHPQRQCPPSPAPVCPPPLQRRLLRVARLQQQEEKPRRRRSATSANSAIAHSRAQNIGRDTRGPVSTLF